MASIWLVDRLKRVIENRLQEVIICLFLLSIFAVVLVVNPSTLVWLGLVQLACDLPEHSKCVAEPLWQRWFGD